jgi:hypothetical protein
VLQLIRLSNFQIQSSSLLSSNMPLLYLLNSFISCIYMFPILHIYMVPTSFLNGVLFCRSCLKVTKGKMIGSGGYFDGSHDPIIMSGSMIHDSSQSSIYDGTNAEEQNFRVTSFSIEDLSNPAGSHLTSEPASVIDHLQHHLGIDIEQGHSGHMMQEAPPVETANLVSAICGIQDHILSHQIGQGPHNMTVEQHILNYGDASYPNGAYTAAHDLLNVLQIHRCHSAPDFPSTQHILGDPLQTTVNHLDMNSDLSGVAIHESGMMFNDSTPPLGYHATQSHLSKDLYHLLPQNYGLLTSDEERVGMIGVPGVSGNIFQETDGRQFDSPTRRRRRQKGGFGKAKVKANFATERERREQLNVKYGALRSLFPNPTKVCLNSKLGFLCICIIIVFTYNSISMVILFPRIFVISNGFRI